MVNSDLVEQLMKADEDGSNSWRRDPKITTREIPSAHFLYKQHSFSTQPQCCLTFYSMGSSVIPCEFLVRSKIYGFLELITCEKQKNILSKFFRTFVHFTDQIRIDPKNGKKMQYLINDSQYEYQNWLRYSSLWASPTDVGLSWLHLRIDVYRPDFMFVLRSAAKNYQIHLQLLTNVHYNKIHKLRKFYQNWTSILKVMDLPVSYLTNSSIPEKWDPGPGTFTGGTPEPGTQGHQKGTQNPGPQNIQVGPGTSNFL